MQITKALSILFFSLTVAACGGGGGSGGGGSQTENERFAEELAFAVTETSKQTIQAQDGGLPSFKGGISPKDLLRKRITSLVLDSVHSKPSIGAIANRTETEIETEVGDCGGTMVSTTTTTEPDDPEASFPFSGVTEIVLNDYCTSDDDDIDDGQVTYNGTLDISFSFIDGSNITFNYSYNVSYVAITPSGQFSGVITANESCETINDIETCTSSSSYDTADGTSYSLSSATVSGDSSSGYDVSGTIIDDDGNSYDVSVSGLTQQCDDSDNVSTGTLTITDDQGETITVTFPNCNDCVVDYLGIANTYSQTQD